MEQRTDTAPSAAFTPGPWAARDGYVYAAGYRLIRLDSSTLGTSTAIRDANARLIAAAPALYEALGSVVAAWDALPTGHYAPATVADWLSAVMGPAIARVRAALRQADGAS